MAAHLIRLLFLAVVAVVGRAHNITEMLSPFPEYSLYSSYLSQTKLADEINSRQTLTCLVLNNAAMGTLAGKHPLSVIKNALSLLVILDYYDTAKLHGISKGTTLSTTLYQTTGNVDGNLGFVNITDLKGGKVGFGSAAPGSPLDSTYTKSVKQIPYNISVLEISAPIIAPGLLTAPAPSPSDVNVTAALLKAGCKTFASLIVSSGVLKIYEGAMAKGLTIFAPSDEAFKAPGVPKLETLTNAEVVQILQYHAVPKYAPLGTLKTATAPFPTLASNGAGKFELNSSAAGDSVTLHTGLGSSRVASTVIDAPPLQIFTVDSILLPSELFGTAPSPAPGLSPETSPSPAPTIASPTPAEAPSPTLPLSPPAPPTGFPGRAPADAPSADVNSPASAAGAPNSPSLVKTLISISGVIISWALASL